MLKTSAFSPAQPRRAETRLARVSFSHRSNPQRTRNVRLGLSLGVALPESPFEHPLRKPKQ
jgi:hypothetical protein